MEQQGHSTKGLDGSMSSGMWETSCSASLLQQGNFPALLFQQAAPTLACGSHNKGCTHYSGLGER